MSFEISLQVNKSEKNRISKTISTITTVSGELKNETSIIDPVIMIQCDLSAVNTCNYMTIPAFKRSYFITNIRSIRQGLVEFTCHVDVLSTYANAIKSNTAIIRKQENNWNLYLNDGTFKVFQNPNVITKPFPQGFTTQEFILAIAGGST